MLEENMKIWNAVKNPPTNCMRPITDGRLKNKTDINPQWRLQALTEQFGICGDGWYYDILKMWTEQVANNEILCFVDINLYYRIPGKDEYSKPIPGTGGNKLVASESKGPHNNDEGFKMALTDAISVAAKALGFGADVYLNRWDGSKWTGENNKTGKPNLLKDNDPLFKEFKKLLADSKITESEFATFLVDKKKLNSPDLGTMSTDYANQIIKGWKAMLKGYQTYKTRHTPPAPQESDNSSTGDYDDGNTVTLLPKVDDGTLGTNEEMLTKINNTIKGANIDAGKLALYLVGINKITKPDLKEMTVEEANKMLTNWDKVVKNYKAWIGKKH